MNNYEKIKKMSLEEMENLLCTRTDCITCRAFYGEDLDIDHETHICTNSKNSVVGIWLREEVKEKYVTDNNVGSKRPTRKAQKQDGLLTVYITITV